MKPMNFPERRNQRRKNALARLDQLLDASIKRLNSGWNNAREVILLKGEIETLKSRIVDSARHVRTKKARPGRAWRRAARDVS